MWCFAPMLPITLHYNAWPPIKHDIPTCWDDVPWATAVKLLQEQEATEHQTVSLLTGIPEDALGMMEPEQIGYITSLLLFIATPPPTDPTPDELIGFDIGQQAWGKLENAKLLISGNGTNAQEIVGTDIIKIYLDKDISGEPTTKAVRLVHFFSSRSIPSFNNSRPFRIGSRSLKKSRRGLTALRNLVSLPHSTHLPRATRSSTMPCSSSQHSPSTTNCC